LSERSIDWHGDYRKGAGLLDWRLRKGYELGTAGTEKRG